MAMESSSIDYSVKALTVREQAELAQIVDQPTYDAAVAVFKGAHRLEQEIIAHHEPMKKAAWDAHRTVVQQEKQLLSPIQEGKQMLSQKIGTWDAQKKAEEEAERRRLENEERKRAEEALLAEAEAAQEAGASQEEVTAILEAPVATPRVAPAPSYTRAAGMRAPTYYSAELTSLAVLVKAAAADARLLPFLQANMTAVNAAARSQKEMFNVPGFRLKKETKAGVSGR